jgi:hypothetical protein
MTSGKNKLWKECFKHNWFRMQRLQKSAAKLLPTVTRTGLHPSCLCAPLPLSLHIHSLAILFFYSTSISPHSPLLSYHFSKAPGPSPAFYAAETLSPDPSAGSRCTKESDLGHGEEGVQAGSGNANVKTSSIRELPSHPATPSWPSLVISGDRVWLCSPGWPGTRRSSYLGLPSAGIIGIRLPSSS